MERASMTNKILMALAVMMASTTVMAQTLVTIHRQNSESTSFDASEISGIVFERVEEQTAVEEEWIDLGLPSGILWRSSNLGAGAPAASGTLIPSAIYKETDGDYIKQISGLSMRSPRREDFEELFAFCSVEKAEVDGVTGVKFTGTNNNSIFLPAAGIHYTNDTHLWKNMICIYWTKCVYFSSDFGALRLSVDNTEFWGFSATSIDYDMRHPWEPCYKQLIPDYVTPDYCLPVRPVKDTVTDVIYNFEDDDWYLTLSSSDYADSAITFDVVASGKPVLTADDDCLTWEITDGGEVPMSDLAEYFGNHRYEFTMEPFHTWTITFTLAPTTELRETTIHFIGKSLPYGDPTNNHILIVQEP